METAVETAANQEVADTTNGTTDTQIEETNGQVEVVVSDKLAELSQNIVKSPEKVVAKTEENVAEPTEVTKVVTPAEVENNAEPAEVEKTSATSAKIDLLVEETNEKDAEEHEEYLLTVENPVEKELKDDENLMKLIQDAVMKTGELGPGEQIMILSTDDDGNTKKIVLRRAEGTDSSEMQQVEDESGNVYVVETSMATDEDIAASQIGDAEENKSDMNNAKPTKLQNIPSHVLGRNILNPSVDPFRNGKAPPKPRLGVKIPYRNLTSQIVSKQEITQEIISRSTRNNRDKPAGQNMFAKRLTQTLAKKLSASSQQAGTSLSGKPGRKPKSAEGFSKAPLDNEELLAILENDTDDSQEASSVEKQSKPPAKTVPEVLTPDMERELALQQLSELPEDVPAEEKKPADKKSQKKAVSPVPVQREKRAYRKKARVQPDEEEQPRFSVAVPLKTYTRKRKPSDDSPPLDIKPLIQQAIASPKSADSPQNVYTTKSSRVIKRKVIWDPDEVAAKKKMDAAESPKKEIKKENENVKKTQQEQIKKSPGAQPERRVGRKRAPEPEEDSEEEQEEEEEEEEQEEEEEEEEVEKPASTPGTPVKQRRRNNEIQKLLQDEGAVNMLYSIKSDDASKRKPNRKSLETKTNEVLSHLQTSSEKVSPKSLRKKEGTPNAERSAKKLMCPPTPSAGPVSRQKSKDSNRSSIHSPPPSPGQSFGGVESRIIRRHSSSSYSSMGEDDDDERKAKKMESRSRRKQETPVDGAKKKLKRDNKNDGFQKLIGIKLDVSAKYNKYKSFKVFALDKLIHVELNDGASGVFITNELMEELVAILSDLDKDKGVNAVLLSSAGRSFCNGLDFKSLIAPKETTRKNLAKKMANNVKELLMKLATFSKVIVAGIREKSVGLGVTMLPLFDMVVACDNSVFHVPNASLGCIAEGGSLLLLPHLSQNVLISELLYNSQTLNSSDALKLGLVTKVLPVSDFKRDLLNNVKSVSEKSAQFMAATKKQLRQRMISDISSSLGSDTENLIEQWSSEECQKHFAEKFK